MKIKRFLAFSLSMVMMVSSAPALVFADETDPETTETTIVETSEPKETEEKKPSETEEKKPAETEEKETEPAESSEETDDEAVPEEKTEDRIPSDTASVEAKNAKAWGKLKWSFNSKTGVLSISGKGNMPAITSDNGAPWYDDRFHIEKIVIGKGITSISDYAFNWSFRCLKA